MKTKIILLMICFSSLTLSNYQNQEAPTSTETNLQSGITWRANGGRFGDNLLSYARTKWLSYKHNLSFFYRSFPYSDQLMMYEKESLYTIKTRPLFATFIHLPLKSDYAIENNTNVLYICQWKTIVNVDWSDTFFISELKKTIAPRQELEKITIPSDCISIAVHVRTGGNYLKDDAAKATHPLRFVPDKFFIAQIKRLAKMFNQENLYVHIFTDHPEPIKLINKFKRQLNNPRISFGYREQKNDYDLNVLEDLFGMMDFDCLIRPQSNFSRFAQILGKNTIAIYPESVRKNADGTSEIDVISIQTRNNEHEAWATKQIVIS